MVACEHEAIPDWLYPDVRGQIVPEGEFSTVPRLEVADFSALWSVLDSESSEAEGLVWQPSHCDVGCPHDAPDHVDRIHPGLVTALAGIADHERWRVARDWAFLRLAKRANEKQLAVHKKMLKKLCDFATSALASDRAIVLFEADESVHRDPDSYSSLRGAL